MARKCEGIVEPQSRVESVVRALLEQNETQLKSIDAEVIRFVEKCKLDRAEKRAKIIASDPTTFHDFSNKILYVARAPGASQLYWGAMDPPMGARNQWWFRKIKNKGIEYPYDVVCAGAHRDERTLIKRHETEARKLRQDRQRKIQTRLELKKELRRLQRITIAV